jgi:hypothetical protein
MEHEGLRVRVKGDELIKRLVDRSAHYRKLAEIQARKRESLERVKGQIADEMREMDPKGEVQAMEEAGIQAMVSSGSSAPYAQRTVNYAKRSDYLKFVAEHIDPNDSFLLNEEELRHYEVLEDGVPAWLR